MAGRSHYGTVVSFRTICFQEYRKFFQHFYGTFPIPDRWNVFMEYSERLAPYSTCGSGVQTAHLWLVSVVQMGYVITYTTPIFLRSDKHFTIEKESDSKMFLLHVLAMKKGPRWPLHWGPAQHRLYCIQRTASSGQRNWKSPARSVSPNVLCLGGEPEGRALPLTEQCVPACEGCFK